MNIQFTSGGVSLEAAAAGNQPRRFRVEPAYSGGALLIRGYSLPVVIDLATLKVDRSIVANLDHDSSRRVGHVADHTIDGRQLLLAGPVSAASESAREFLDSAAAGFPWQASVEARPGRLEDVPQNKTVQVNGRSFKGPLTIARESTLYGVAFLSKGADPTTQVLVASKGPAMLKRNQSMTDAEIEAAGRAYFDGVAATENTILASGDPLIDAERERIRQIELVCRGDFGPQAEHVAELKAQAIAGEIEFNALRAGVLEALRASRPNLNTFRPQASRHDVPQRAIEASFCLQGGLPNIEKHYDAQTLDAADRFSRMGLQELLLTAAIEGGYHHRPGERVSDGNLRAILTYAFPDIRAAGFSTLSVGGILSNVANKFLIDGWAETSGTEWRSISMVRPVRDFKTNSFYRLLDSCEYELVGAGGEIPHGSLGESTYTVKADTYARMMAITRRDIVNDDAGAFLDVPRRLGQAAGMAFRRLFWRTFLNHDSFFAAQNGNYLGTGSQLGVDGTGLDEALQYFRAQRTPDGDGSKLIGGRPAVMLVPPALETTARRLLNSTNIVSGDAGPMPAGNPFFGVVGELAVVDWLADDSLHANADDAAWYLFRSPQQAPAVLVAFLGGQEAPMVESADADFNTLGVQFRGVHDFGVSLAEQKCGVKCTGEPLSS